MWFGSEIGSGRVWVRVRVMVRVRVRVVVRVRVMKRVVVGSGPEPEIGLV